MAIGSTDSTSPTILKSAGDLALAMLPARIYDKWFMQPIPPTNTKIGLAVSEATKAAWANPNDKPMEDYAKK